MRYKVITEHGREVGSFVKRNDAKACALERSEALHQLVTVRDSKKGKNVGTFSPRIGLLDK